MMKKIIFPKPEACQVTPGTFYVPQTITFAGWITKVLQSAAEEILGSCIEMKKQDTNAVMFLEKDTSLLGESYQISIDEDGIYCKAGSESGMINSFLTVSQLMIQHNNKVPYVRISDSPCLEWRGIMLDIGRHFHNLQEIKRLVHLIAMFKINKLHLHLTDDQGWRIESKKYPKLTKIGSIRQKTMISTKIPTEYRDTPHAGFLSRKDVKELVSFAELYNVEIIPEIDLPGHTLAALAAYPEFGCRESYEVGCDFGIHDGVLCLGKKETLEFCKTIISEIGEMFPSSYIHIGGDEVPVTSWEQCPECVQKKEELGLSDFSSMQDWFTEELRKHAESIHKTLICWNDAIQKKISKNIVIQYWLNKKREFNEFILNQGRGIISDYYSSYLDHSHKFTSLKDVFHIRNKFKSLLDTGRILGLEAPVWTEWIPNRERLDHQIFPRIVALAEAAWQQNPDWSAFKDQLANLYDLLHKLGIFPAGKKTVLPIVPFKSRYRNWELNHQWDTSEYRSLPIIGVPSDISTRIR